MYGTQQSRLPFSPDEVDGRTFNPNLPHQNDVWPKIQLPAGMPPQLAEAVVTMFRFHAQDRSGKSKLHAFTYNALSQNYFANDIMLKWCQLAVDFTDYLIQFHRKPPQEAVDKAATKAYLSLLAVTYAQFQNDMNQLIPQQMTAQLFTQLQEYQDICKDVSDYLQRKGQPVQNGYAGAQVSGQVYAGSAQNTPTSSLASLMGNYATGGVANAQPQPVGRGGGMYATDVATPKTNSWTAGQPLNNQTVQQPVQQAPVYQEPMENCPQSVDEIELDPYAYKGRDLIVDKLRPYDEIRAPGGIVIIPAHLASKRPKDENWKWTAGDDQPYLKAYDNERYVRFLVRWPDGRVKEKIVEADRPEMEYLLHEINDELRNKAIRPTGIMVERTDKIVDSEKEVVTLDEAVATRNHEQDGHLDDEANLAPITMNVNFCSASTLENEFEARKTLREALELPEDAKLPPHEYLSTITHHFEVSDECYNELVELPKMQSFEAVIKKVKELLEQNHLSIRYYRFLDDRLTTALNTYLKDSFSLSIKIDSFMEDGASIGPYLAKKKGEEYQQMLDESVEPILGKAITFAQFDAADGAIGRGLAEQFLNFQVAWMQQDLENLKITKEPLLLSGYTHPRVTRVVKGMIERASELDLLRTTRLRLITADGAYYEIIRGKLVKNAVLLKQL